MDFYPEINHTLKDGLRLYQDPWKQFLKRLLMQVYYFQRLPMFMLEQLVYKLRQKVYSKGSFLMRPGDISPIL